MSWARPQQRGPSQKNESVERGKLRRNLLDHRFTGSGSKICLSGRRDSIVGADDDGDDDDSIRVITVLVTEFCEGSRRFSHLYYDKARQKPLRKSSRGERLRCYLFYSGI